ncbi:MAG TPA: glycosyltransferase family 2 protein [Longimicrobiales bacterium]|nr:glycosyltransferase family 2 protein [Longimicrobiales bacterium]
MADDRILAIIPAYEAAHLVPEVIRGATPHLPVLVLDDGSRDDTSGAARAAGAEVIRQEPNQGKGAALKRGFFHALEQDYDAVLTLDADGQHDPAEIPAFLAAWRQDHPDLIIGARSFEEMPFVRRMSNTIGRWSLSRAVGRDILDNQSGYRFLSRRLVESMLESGEKGFEFEVEMVLLCLRRKWPIAWVPIRTIYAGQGSHISPLDHVVQFFRMVRKARKAARSL